MKLERTLKQYENGVPEVIAEGSKAQIVYCISDAKKDVLALCGMVKILADAIEGELESLEEDIRWADSSGLEGMICRRTKLQLASSKAKEILK